MKFDIKVLLLIFALLAVLIAKEESHKEDEHGHVHIEVSKESKEEVGLRIAKVKRGDIVKKVDLTGEIGFNEDKLLPVVPRFAGIVKSVRKRVGDSVRKGDLLAIVENNETMSSYNIYAPMSGTVLEKDVVQGAFVSGEEPIYLIGDLQSVWVNLELYDRDVTKITKGSSVIVTPISGGAATMATISYIAPLYTTGSRTTLVRATIDNKEGIWKPGMFVNGTVMVTVAKDVPRVYKKAVQTVNGHTTLFVPESATAYSTAEIEIGSSNKLYAEVKSGISENEPYVSAGSFALKSHMMTQALGEHAGCGGH